MSRNETAAASAAATVAPALGGVPETMLWTLHNRASEARRADGVIRDPRCLEIYGEIAYDYVRSFGAPEPSHGIRSAVFDALVRDFVRAHPDAVIVNLGEGLETQRFRVPTDTAVLWLSIDVPEAIAVRERFIAPDDTHRHVPRSALDLAWLDEVPKGRPVLITAQGLFMYFDEAQVARLLGAIAQRWPSAEIAFDYVPRWLSRKSTSARGWWKTPHYRVPPLPWGITGPEVAPAIRRWTHEGVDVREVPFVFPRGWRRTLFGALTKVPWVRDHAPGVTHVRLRGAGAA